MPTLWLIFAFDMTLSADNNCAAPAVPVPACVPDNNPRATAAGSDALAATAGTSGPDSAASATPAPVSALAPAFAVPAAAKGRNQVISICKGIAIILMVAGHAECPGALMNFIYLFHMPVFFIAAGYFFQRKYITTSSWEFVRKRFRGLYWPMVKWSVVFLLLHNAFFAVGLLNEQFGNWEGGVTHPYTWHQAMQRLVNIVFSMGGYDEFLLGAFWFFRALLVSGIVFMALNRLLEGRRSWLHGERTVLAVIVLALAFAVFRLSFGLRIQTIVQGGIRENWGVIFFGVGVLFRCYEHRLRHYWAVGAVALSLLVVGANMHLAGMNLAPKLIDALTLPLTGTIGFVMVYCAAVLLNRRGGVVRRLLVHVGEMTVYIYVFHIISFKAVSAIKIMWYGLPWGQIGCHMVIHEHHDDLFWLLYTVAGVSLPLLWMCAYSRLRAAWSR